MESTFSTLLITVSFVAKVFASNRTFTCGVLNGHPTEYDALNFFVNHTSNMNNISVSVMFKEVKMPEGFNLYNQASLLNRQNLVALIEGSISKTPGCALLKVTGIPVIRLHGDEGRWHEAGYFHLVSQRSKVNVNFMQLSNQGEGEDPTAPIFKALEQIENLEAEVILLYARKEKVELMLKQAFTSCDFACSSAVPKRQKSCKHRNKWILQGQVPLNISSDRNNIVFALKLPYIQSSTSDELQQAVRSDIPTKDLAALAFDAAHVINQAVNREPCSQINGSSITPKDTDAMLTCIRKIGTWNSTKGAVLFEKILHNVENLSNNKSLQGKKLRVVVVKDDPFVMEEKQDDGSSVYEGYCIDLLNELARNLKFTYEIYPSPDELYGAETENGTWDGTIGELISERADIAVAELTITERREKVVDFSVPFMHYTEDLLMKKPSSSRPTDLLQFMNPFHYYVWVATLASLVVISVAVHVINYFSPYGYKNENSQGTSEEFNFFNSAWFALASMLQQGADNTSRSLSGRILTGSYWFCVLILVSTYTANLAAFLTVKNYEQPINNLEDIAGSIYKVAVLESSSTHEFFKTSQYAPYKKIWHRIQMEGTIVKSASQGIQWVREKDKFVFTNDGPILRYVANKKPCDLTTVPGLTTAKGLALAFQANDSHLDDFTLAILRLHENGFLNSLRRKWWETKNECPKEQETMLSQKRIDLMSMLGVYVVMGAGMIVALLTLIAEILWNRRAEQKLIKRTKRQKIYTPQNGSEVDCPRR